MPTLRMLPVCVLAAVLLWHSPARVAGQSSGPPRLLPNPNPSSFISDAPVNFNVTCNPFFQTIMLQQLYQVTGGPQWTTQSKWLTTDVCLQRAINGSTVQLPAYCCWFGISCCIDRTCGNSTATRNCGCIVPGMVTQIRLPRNNLIGPWPNNLLSWLACELTFVDFSFNNLSGNISGNISNVINLETLALGNNRFTGTLPPEIRLLSKLQVLDLTANSLTGTIPQSLCNYENASVLTDILLANNNFIGQYDVPLCTNLVALDLTRNSLTGVLPTFEGYDMLHIARIGRNRIQGTIPATVDSAPLLMDLDVSGNLLSGTIPLRMSTLRLVSYLRMNFNNLTGTIPRDLFTSLGNLVRMNLANNYLTGTIPNADPELGTLVLMDLSNNSLLGTIPETFSGFAEPDISMSLQLNLLSCCGTNPVRGPELLTYNYTWQAYGGVNQTLAKNSNTLLPSFLTFSQYVIPVGTGKDGNVTNMRCPEVLGKTKDPKVTKQLNWKIDPSYYLFTGCNCPSGYYMLNTAPEGRLPHYICQEEEQPWYVKSPWILALIIIGATSIVIVTLFLLYYRKGAKPAFVHQYNMMRKRIKGEPKDGPVAVVTTDIEGYSDLMKREPELMGKGLRIHNFCIDKARWQFVGYTMEQEGDSFIIAFHDPFDAVAFCLQAQLLLQHVEWPEKLLNPGGGIERGKKSSILTQALQGVKTILGRGTSEKSVMMNLGDAGSSFEKAGSSGTGEEALWASGGSGQASKGGGSYRVNISIPEERAITMSTSSLTPTSGPNTAPNTVQSSFQNEAQQAVASTRQNSSITLGAMSMEMPMRTQTTPSESSGIRILSTATQGTDKQLQVFNGLRVRMGIATGDLGKGGVKLRSTPIMERSKVVSDAGAGGQILMDEETFQAIKPRLVELGAVDHNGLSFSKMNLSHPTIMQQMCTCGKTKQKDETDIALVLDMGQYVHAQGAKGPRVFSTPAQSSPGIAPSPDGKEARATAAAAGDHSPHRKKKDTETLAPRDSAGEAMAGHVDVTAQRLHLYQIVSPPLVERARFFGSKLALKDDWICVDPPYFSAPGAAAAALGLDVSSSIPPITMVFCAMDGVKDWKQINDKSKRQAVQRIIKDVLINTLVSVKGSYLCRLQEDEFKYMVAFPEPEDAAKWCLIIQDALMWQDWPEWMLKQDKAKEEYDERGAIVFRGPRLRMGMCHGCPRAIVPDHMGRADYHGASINSAARYMDAAAHGGMVVCEEETALSIISIWNGINPHRGSRLTPPTPHDPRAQALPLTAALSEHVLPALPPEFADGLANPFYAAGQPQGGGPLTVTVSAFTTGTAPLADAPPAPRAHTVPPLMPSDPSLSSYAALLPPLPQSPQAAAAAAVPTVSISLDGSDADGDADTPHAAAGLALTPVRTSTGPSKSTRNNDNTSTNYGNSNAVGSTPHSEGEQSVSPFERAGGFTPTGTRLDSPRSATAPGHFQGSPSGGSEDEIGPAANATRTDNNASSRSPSPRLSAGNVPPAPLRASSPGRTGSPLGLRSASPRNSSKLSQTTTAFDPEPAPKRDPSTPTKQGQASQRGGILKKPGSGAAAGAPPAPKSGVVRITTPSRDGRASGASAATAATGGASVANTAGLPTQASMETTANALTYKTSVSAIRLGAYLYKGSPDEIQMVHLILESMLGRRFPADPPKGKGNRVSVSTGLAGFAPTVELPNIARRYFWAWRTHYNEQVGSQPATPRGGGGGSIKGWLARAQSARHDDDRATGGSARTLASAPSMQRGGVMDMLERSKRELAGMLRRNSHKALGPDGDVGRASSASAAASENGAAGPALQSAASAPLARGSGASNASGASSSHGNGGPGKQARNAGQAKGHTGAKSLEAAEEGRVGQGSRNASPKR